MTSTPPTRLKSSPDTSPELSRALRALREEPSDQARVARVGERLGAILDAPMRAPHPTAGSTLFKSLWVKLGASALLVIGAATWLAWPDTAARSTQAAASPIAAAAPVSSKPAPSPATSRFAVPEQPGDDTPVVPTATALPARALEPKNAPRTNPALRANQRVHKQPVELPSMHADPTRSQIESENSNAPATPGTALTASDHGEPDAGAPEPPTRAPRRNEVELLLEARRVIRDDAEAAMRILAEHAARFPAGMLALEREVLAIEALRKLGRDAEAARRLARFRAEHPESLHLPALR
jgi:hypothetical protein